jgi:diguanylate cyclase (GGDEF)-like protein
VTDELRLRARMIGAGLWLSGAFMVTVGLWIAVTWSHPHRDGLTALLLAAIVITLVIARLPRERVVTSRWREAFFLGWSLSLVAFVATAAELDSGVRSPVVLTLFLTLVYAALSYPPRSVGIVSVASLLALVIVGWVHTGPVAEVTDPIYLIGLMLTLAATGVICVFQARLQQQARGELRLVSRSDPLTGALNRLGFSERMSADMAGARRDGEPLSIALLDFDGFKEINDAHGHPAGDALLCWAVDAMGTALRPGDSLARLGGDEFAAILPATDLQEGVRVADRLTLALSLRISACAGVAATDRDGWIVELLHQRADQRLYQAKRERPASPARHVIAG